MKSWSALCVGLIGAVSAAVDYPMYKQCDPSWGDDEMGVDGPGERASICSEGCAMSCVTMALAAQPGMADLTPGTFNAWLKAHQGYHCDGGDCNNLVLDAPERILQEMTGKGSMFTLINEGVDVKPSLEVLVAQAAAGTHVFAMHVRNNHHFVLATGFNSTSGNITVNDPGFDQAEYAYEDVSDVIAYSLVAHVPRQFPLFKQCNASWGNDTMVDTTVCKVGCLMSSLSMALGGHSINIPLSGMDYSSDPGTFNQWLIANKGYDDFSDLEEAAVPALSPDRIAWPADGMHRTNDLSEATVQQYLDAGRTLIANVNKGGHFVLLTGYELSTSSSSTSTITSGSTTYFVHDPGFMRGAYSFADDIVGWRIFDISD